MKLYAILSLILFLTMLFVPLFSLLGNTQSVNVSAVPVTSKYMTDSSSRAETREDEGVSTRTEKEKENVSETETEKIETGGEISVLRVSSGKVESVDLREYVIGCVASEMPASYSLEALKAQAVVSRTYAMYMREVGGESDISDDPSVHQAYTNLNELKEKWGDGYEKNIAAIEKAVDAVEGEYLTYESRLIQPPYFALSCGSTNNAEDVWGTKIDWLVSVPSAADALSVSVKSIFEFTKDEIISALKDYKITDVTVGEIVKSENGYVKKIDISSHSFSGEELRRLLSLRSGNFTVEKSGDLYVFTCMGYGHGVGMSQYGANCMAKEGSSYKEILAHYYPGTEISD